MLMSPSSIGEGNKSQVLFNILKRATFSLWTVIGPITNPQAGGPPLVGCLLLPNIRREGNNIELEK
jgi:hypothetical protein